MNKISKIILSILGACNKVMLLFTPPAVALMSIQFFGLRGANAGILMGIALSAMAFRAIHTLVD